MEIELTVFYARRGSIALILALGFLLGKLKLISEKTNHDLTNLLLTVFMPASLFMAFPSEYDQASANLFFAGLLGGFLVMFMLIILAKLIFNKKWMKKACLTNRNLPLFLITQLFLAIQLLPARLAQPAF